MNNKNKRKNYFIAGCCILVSMIFAGTVSCSTFTFEYKKSDIQKELQTYIPVYPEAKFAVFSDPHIYDVSLGTEGEDFQEYLQNDRKMLVQSEEILLEAINMIREENVQFVIVSGDLTKDGEKVSHTLMAAHLTALENRGISVFVVPGNHDILNPHAQRFSTSGVEPVQQVSPEEFAAMYGAYGYDESIARDPNSLSYVAEPVEGLWLLALDSVFYENNIEDDYPKTGGRFTQEEVDWIEMILQRAVRENKAVIAVMHHGILEHYDSQAKYFGDYIVEKYEAVSEMFARYKVRLCFTGHYHAQDITRKRWDENTFLYDIETGSLVTYPCPVRFITIEKQGTAEVRSRFIAQIPSFNEQGKDFQAFGKEYVYTGIEGIAVKTMVDLNMKKEEAETLSGQIADAFIAHYKGDEKFTGESMLRTEELSFMGRLVVGNRKALVYGLWQDKEPPDNDIRINLMTGEY